MSKNEAEEYKRKYNGLLASNNQIYKDLQQEYTLINKAYEIERQEKLMGENRYQMQIEDI